MGAPTSCRNCNSPYVSAERSRDIGGGLVEFYVWCPVCHKINRTRMSTARIEAIRGTIARWQKRVDRARERGQVSSVAERALALQMDELAESARRAGLTEQVPELCQPHSASR